MLLISLSCRTRQGNPGRRSGHCVRLAVRAVRPCPRRTVPVVRPDVPADQPEHSNKAYCRPYIPAGRTDVTGGGRRLGVRGTGHSQRWGDRTKVS